MDQRSLVNVGPSYRNLDFVNPENHDDGVELVLVLRRRLMSAILTIYLPTVLILTIVYATNFFKDFFFEVSWLLSTGKFILNLSLRQSSL